MSYRIIYGPRGGGMRYVVQRKMLFWWVDEGGHDWIGWRDTHEKAKDLVEELRLRDGCNSKHDVVVEP